MRAHKATVVSVLAVVSMLLSAGALADEDGDGAAKKAREKAPAAGKAGGDKGTKIAVFPLEGINVNPKILEASTEVLTSAFITSGFTVADWKVGFRKVTGEDPDAPPPPPERRVIPLPEETPIMAAPMPSDFDSSAGGAAPEGSAPVAEESEEPPAGSGEARPTPPPAPYRRVTVPARPSGYRRAPAETRRRAPARTTLKIGTELKAQIAKELGCEYYMDGKLVMLGTKTRITVEKHNTDGDAVDARVMEGRSEDDLIIIFERMAIAFASNKGAEETLELDNATRAEALRRSNRFRLEKNFGVMIGETFSFSDDMTHFTRLGFDGRLEMKQLLVDINAGLGLTGGEDPKAHFIAGVGLGYYLTQTSVAPYLGAGFGIFAGERVNTDEPGNGDWNDDGDSDEDVAVGFELYPAVGIEFLRHSSIRVHIDFRYNFSVVTDSAFGHGLTALIGINF